jgi:hypothetical protein
MNSPKRPETKTENFALIASSILATAAYLVMLREFYSWWIVVPATLLALPIAAIVSSLLMEFAAAPVGRVICLAMGGVLLWTALTQDHRSGSAFMGLALSILGAAARKTEWNDGAKT